MSVHFSVRVYLTTANEKSMTWFQCGTLPTDRHLHETLVAELAAATDDFLEASKVSLLRGMTITMEIQS